MGHDMEIELTETKSIVAVQKKEIETLRKEIRKLETTHTSSNINEELQNENNVLKEDLLRTKEILEVGGNSITHLRNELAKLKKHYKAAKSEKLEYVHKITHMEKKYNDLLQKSSEKIRARENLEVIVANDENKRDQANTRVATPRRTGNKEGKGGLTIIDTKSMLQNDENLINGYTSEPDGRCQSTNAHCGSPSWW